MAIHSLDRLLSQFGTSPSFHVQFYCFLICIQISQEAGKVLWYSYFFKNFPQFVVIHTVQGFSVVNETEVDVFLEFSCSFCDPADVGYVISVSSAFSKSSLNIWKFYVYVQLKPSLKNFEHYSASVWIECSCVVLWTFFGIAFLWDYWNLLILFFKLISVESLLLFWYRWSVFNNLQEIFLFIGLIFCDLFCDNLVNMYFSL